MTTQCLTHARILNERYYRRNSQMTSSNLSRGRGQTLFSDAQRQDKGNGHKVKHRKFRLNMRKNFFPLRVTEHCNRLPREVVESPSLEIFRTHLYKVLCSLL